jgi:hypothetical protein
MHEHPQIVDRRTFVMSHTSHHLSDEHFSELQQATVNGAGDLEPPDWMLTDAYSLLTSSANEKANTRAIRRYGTIGVGLIMLIGALVIGIVPRVHRYLLPRCYQDRTT